MANNSRPFSLFHLTGKIVRPRYSTTLGIHIINIRYAFLGKYKLTVKYFSTDRGVGIDTKDTLYMSPEEIIQGFEVLVNAPYIKSFKKARWKPLVKFREFNATHSKGETNE